MSANIFYSADYDGLELRTMAQAAIRLVGFSDMALVLNSGKDVHLDLASSILSISYDDAEKKHPQEQKDFSSWRDELAGRGLSREAATIQAGVDVPMPVDNARQTAKIANLGFAGGLGADKLCLFARKTYKVSITVDEAKTLKRDWLNRWREFRSYFARVDSDLRQNHGTIKQLFSNRLRGGTHYTAGCNTLFQGLGADATKNALFLVSRACYSPTPCLVCSGSIAGCEWCRACHGPGISPLYGSRPVNYVHDEIIGECSEPWGHCVAHELVRNMIAGAAPFLPDVPATAKPQLMRYWSKQAKPVWIVDPTAPGAAQRKPEKGRLVAWPMAA